MDYDFSGISEIEPEAAESAGQLDAAATPSTPKYDFSRISTLEPFAATGGEVWEPAVEETVYQRAARATNRWAALPGLEDHSRLDKTHAELRKYLGEGVPPASLFTLAQATQQLKNTQMDHATRNAPHTARWAVERGWAGRVPYDLPGLAKVEKSYGQLLQEFFSKPIVDMPGDTPAHDTRSALYAYAAGPSAIAGHLAQEELPATKRVISAMPGDLAGGLLETVRGGIDVTKMLTDNMHVTGLPLLTFMQGLRTRLKAAGFTMAEDAQEGASQFLGGLAESIKDEVPPEAGTVEKGVRSGVASMGGTIPLLLLAGPAAAALRAEAAAGTLFSAGMGVSVAGNTYRKNLEQHGDPQRAALHGILDGMAEFVFEKLGGDVVLLDKAAWAKGFLGGVVKFVAREVPSEIATTLTQNYNDWTFQNPEKSLDSFLSEQPEAVLETIVATLVGGGGQIAVMKGLESAANLVNGSAQADTEQQKLQDLFTSATEAELFQNDPQAFGEFMQSVAPDQEVRIDAALLEQALVDAGKTTADVPSLLEQGNLPGEISVPMHELVTALAGTPSENTVIQNIRTDPEARTIAERRELGNKALEEFKATGARALEERRADERFQGARDALREEIAADLEATGAYKPGATSTFADMVTTMHSVVASRLGVTPLQLRDGWTDAKGNAHKGYNLTAAGTQGPVKRDAPAATAKDFAPGRIGNILRRKDWAIVTAENPNNVELSPEENAARNEVLRAELQARGLRFKEATGAEIAHEQVEGKYVAEGQEDTAPLEHPFLVLGIDLATAREIAKKFDQESVLTPMGLVYHDNTVERALNVQEHETEPANYWTRVPSTGALFTLNLDFGNRVPLGEDTAVAAPPVRGVELRHAVVHSADLMGDGRGFTDFFSGASHGLKKPDIQPDPVIDIAGIPEFSAEYVKHRGNFDDHIAASIPGFREVQQAVGSAVAKTYAAGGVVLDVGASEGAWGKTVSAVTDGKVRTVNLDPNLAMAEHFNTHSTVPGAEYVVEAFGSKEDEGKEAWQEGDTPINFFKPDTKFDVIHEAMVFQFISNGRNAQVARMKELLKPGGLVLLEEKIIAVLPGKPSEITPEQIAAFTPEQKAFWDNEIQKDAYKAKHFSAKAIEEKKKVLEGDPAAAEKAQQQEQAVVGMNDLMATAAELEAVLSKHFNHVVQYWDSGNFKGFAASDNQSGVEAFLHNLPDLTSGYSTTATPSAVRGMDTFSQRTAGSVTDEIKKLMGKLASTEPGPSKEKLNEKLRALMVERTRRMDAEYEAARQMTLFQPAPAEPLTVVGLHFSPKDQQGLSPAAYRRGIEGAERERVMSAKDARIKRRAHFYVNTGVGIFPEAGVGTRAHVVTLTNLYDASVDPLGLFRDRSPSGMNAAESAVLDAGFDGYVSREFGNQGAAVVFRPTLLAPEFIGTEDEVVSRATVIPPAKWSTIQKLRIKLLGARNLPAFGPADMWDRIIGKLYPEEHAVLKEQGVFERAAAKGDLYKDELLCLTTPVAGEFYQRADLFPEEFADENSTFTDEVVVSSSGRTEKRTRGNVNSSGRQITGTMRGLRNFWEWYGDGPVDEKGRPVVMYHGTKADFEAFESGREGVVSHTFGSYATQRHGMFFTPDAAFAEGFALQGEDSTEANIVTVYTAIHDYADLSVDGLDNATRARLEDAGVNMRWLDQFRPWEVWEAFDGEDGRGFVTALQTAGFDGAYMEETDPETDQVKPVWIAFSPAQIKSATGNRGTYSREDDSLLHQKVWHGTPNVWPPEPGFPHGRPRLNFVGTEGGTAFGFGWYSAEVKDVAQTYAGPGEHKGGPEAEEKLTKRLIRAENAGRYGEAVALEELLTSRSPVKARARFLAQPDSAQYQEALKVVDELAGNYVESGVYQLDIPESAVPYLLDWNKPLREQAPEVQAALKSSPVPLPVDSERIEWKDAKGETLYWKLSRERGGDRAASEFLNSLGIVGHRYLDGRSRRAGTGSANYVIWDQPTLDKIAVLERNGEALDAARLFQIDFYSPLLRAFANVKQTVMPGGQWAAWLRSNQSKLGLKTDEIFWTGLDNYLELRSKERVTKDEIVDHLEKNQVKTTRVVKGGNALGTAAGRALAEEQGHVWADLSLTNQERYIRRAAEEQQIDNRGEDVTKFSRAWSEAFPEMEPGSYRETLEVLPVAAADESKFREYQSGLREKYGTDLAILEEGTVEEKAKLESLGVAVTKPSKDSAPFKGSHWEEANVLAHTRTAVVVDALGMRHVLVGELQSDWGQQGEDKGFATGTAEKEAAARKAYRDAIKRDAPEAEQDSLKAEVDAAVSALEGAPDAPFVTGTKAWVALGVKSAIARALEAGVDGVVFANGKQNADIYSLRKQVGSISYTRGVDGLYDLDVKGLNYGEAFGEGRVLREFGIGLDRIEELVGRGIAHKIEANAGREVGAPEGSGELSGLDLEIGGEGMLSFYGDENGRKPNGEMAIVPSVVNGILRRLGGGKLEKIEFPSTVEVTRTRAEAEATGGAFGKWEEPGENATQLGFYITPAMRDKIAEMGGLPLFQGRQDARGTFSPERLEYTLLAQADLSTFMHEIGHFFLTVHMDLALEMQTRAADGETLAEGEQGILDDMDAVLAWMGDGLSLRTWAGMPLAQQRPYHEKFAETWEQYLFTGKAPTKKLESLFRRLSDWMRRVYLDLKRFLSQRNLADLNPEISAILDRMVATEREIAAAQERRAQELIFKNAVEAGMTPEQYAKYMTLPEEAKAEAEEQLRARALRDMKWMENRRNKTIAALQKEAAEKRKEMRASVAEEVAEEPVFKAQKWLRHGIFKTDTGEEIQALKGYKLHIPALEAMFPAGVIEGATDWRKLGYGKYGMLAAEGIHPDMVAEMFGYRSGMALVDGLLNAPNFKAEVEGRTDQRMLEKYGDLATPEGIARAADEAIMNDVRLKILATEMSYLNNAMGSPAAITRAARAYAQALIASRVVKNLKPAAYAADAARAGKAAMAAFGKGESDLAAEQKRLEVLHHASAREAYAAEKEINKIGARLTKIAKVKNDDSSAKNRNMDAVNAVRVTLSAFGFGTVAQGENARRYLDALKQQEPEIAVAMEDLVLTATVNSKHWRNLKVAELRELSELVESIWSVARRAKEMEIEGKLVSRQTIVDELLAAIEAHEPATGKPDIGTEHAVTPEEQRKLMFSTFKALFRRVSDWAEAIDGGKKLGPFRKYVWFPVKDAADKYRAAKVATLKQYRELLKPISDNFGGALIDAPELGYVFGKDPGVPAMSELLHALLHTGNESNKRKLLLGRGWAAENEDGTLDTTRWDRFTRRMQATGTLNKDHYDFVQGVWDMLEGTKGAAQKAHRAVLGRSFDEVTANAFTTPFGAYAGGYVPAMVDSRIESDAALRELANAENESMVNAFPTPAKGFTLARVDYNRKLLLDLRALAGHVDKVLLFSYLAEPIADVRRVLMSPELSKEINRIDPAAISSMFTPWLNRAAKQVVEVKKPGAGSLGRFWSAARSRAGMAAMFANVVNTMQQFTGIFTAAVKVKPSYLIEANAQYLVHPKDTFAFVTENSPYMLERLTQGTASMTGDVNDILINPSKFETVKAWSSKHAYFLQTAVDQAMGPIIWMGAYKQGLDLGDSHEDARKAADDVVRQTQGSQLPEEIANYEVGSPFYRMFTQFSGFFNAQANMLGTEFSKVSHELGLKSGLGRGFFLFAFGVLAPAMVSELIVQALRGGPGDEDDDGEYLDDWISALTFGTARYVTAMAPGVGPAAIAMWNTFNHKPYDDRMSTAPAISMVETAVKSPASVYKAWAEDESGKPGRAIMDSATTVSMLLGVPARSIAKPFAYAADVEADYIEPADGLDYARGLVTGTASPESKQ